MSEADQALDFLPLFLVSGMLQRRFQMDLPLLGSRPLALGSFLNNFFGVLFDGSLNRLLRSLVLIVILLDGGGNPSLRLLSLSGRLQAILISGILHCSLLGTGPLGLRSRNGLLLIVHRKLVLIIFDSSRLGLLRRPLGLGRSVLYSLVLSFDCLGLLAARLLGSGGLLFVGSNVFLLFGCRSLLSPGLLRGRSILFGGIFLFLDRGGLFAPRLLWRRSFFLLIVSGLARTLLRLLLARILVILSVVSEECCMTIEELKQGC